MKRKLIKAAATVAACIAMATSAIAQDVKTLRLAIFIPEAAYIGSVFNTWSNKVGADSKGTLAIKPYYGGSLGHNPAEQLALVQNGIADIAWVIPSFMPGVYDDYAIAELPIAHTSIEGSIGLANAFDKGLLPTPQGVKIIAVYANTPATLHLSKPVANALDVGGRKIQAYNKTTAKALAALGATAASIPAQEVVEGVSRGVIDGAAIEWGSMEQNRLYEVAKNHIDYQFGAFSHMIVIKSTVWDSLPQTAKDSLTNNGGRTFAKFVADLTDANTARVKDLVMAMPGNALTKPTAEERAKLDAISAKLVADWLGTDEHRKAIYDAYQNGIASVSH